MSYGTRHLRGETDNTGITSQRSPCIAAALSSLLRRLNVGLHLEIPRSRVAPADTIVVPGLALTASGRARGLLHNRIAMATLLMRQGLAPRLLVSGGKPRRGVTEAVRMVELATALGVPRHAIVVEAAATTSRENAWLVAARMCAGDLRSGLLVTDYFHLVYALPLFREAFSAHALELYWAPVSYRQLRKLGLLRGYLRPL